MITALRPSEAARRLSLVVVLLLAALVLFLLGAGVTAVAALFGSKGPGVLLGLALAPVLAVAIVVVPLVGPLLVFATFPVGTTAVPTPVVSLQAVELAVLLVAGLVILARVARGVTPAPWAPALWWPAALVVWTVILVPSAIDTTLATKQLASLIGGILFAVVLLAACDGMTDVRRVLGGLVAVATVIALTGLTSGVDFHASGAATTVGGRLSGTFDHPNQLGAFCAMVAPVAAGLLFGARTLLGRAAAGAAMLGILVALLLSLSRGGWIGAFAAFIFLLVVLPQARRLLLAVSIPLVVAVAIAWSSASTLPEVTVVGARARAFTTLSPYDGRGDIYREAWREIREAPVTGQGPAGFSVASARAESEAATVHADHAHNLLLTWAAETGFPGLLLILGFAGALTVATRKASRLARLRGDPADHALVAGVAGGLLAVFVQGAVDYTLRNAVVWITLWTLIGVLLVSAREAPATSRSRGA